MADETRTEELIADVSAKADQVVRAAAEGATTLADNLSTSLDRAARDQPKVTLGVALFIGFVLGALWKS